MTVAEATKPKLTREDLWAAWRYMPTAAQKEILDDTSTFQLVAGGWRGGKSATASVKAATETIGFIGEYGQRAAGQVAWLVANSYELTRAEKDYITEYMRKSPLGVGVKSSTAVNPGSIRIPVPGGGYFTIRTKSADDPQTLAMEAPVWIVVCEAAQVSQEVYENLIGRTLEARQNFPGYGWVHMEGTFEGSLGWYPALWTKWQSPAVQSQEDARSFSLPTDSNTITFPGGWEENPELIRIKATTPDSLFSEKYLGVPVPPSGRVHAAFDSAVHIRNVEYDPDLPVYLGIDPGYSGQPSTYAVEAAQLVSIGETGFQQWRVFDEIAVNKHAMPGFTVKDVCQIAKGKFWWSNPDKKGFIDVAGETHAGAQESNAETWMKETGMVLMAGVLRGPNNERAVRIAIDRVDQSLKQDPISREPGIIIDPACELIISEFGGGPNPFDRQTHVYSWMTNRNNEVIGRTPKDAYCDGIKAFAYMAYHVQGPAFAGGERRQIKSKRRRDLASA